MNRVDKLTPLRDRRRCDGRRPEKLVLYSADKDVRVMSFCEIQLD